jgi:hypothetical protein
MERMPEKYRKVLLGLCKRFIDSRGFNRAARIRRATRARYFWQGLQNIWWSENEGIYKVYGIDKLPEDVAPPHRREGAINLFRAFGLALAAVVSDGKIVVRFWPQNPSQQDDLDTAKEASTLSSLIERQNDMDTLSIEECYLAYLDPVYAFHVRYVVDGEEYGYDEIDQMDEGQAQVGEDHMFCAACQKESPVPPVDPGQDLGELTSPCPNCGTPLSASDYVPADLAPIPVSQGPRRFPRGQVRIELVSDLELDFPRSAKSQREVSDLRWSTEVHRSKLMATYPHAADVIRKESSGGSRSNEQAYQPGTIDESTERRARMRAKTMTSQNQVDEGLLTWHRHQLRGWAFEELAQESDDDKETYAVMKSAFPDGGYVGYFGDTYIEARNERLDDSWRLVGLMPGESFDSGAIGADGIPVQRRYTILDDIAIDTAQHGVPPNFADKQTLDLDAFGSTTANPGAYYEAERPAGGRLSDGFYSPPAAEPSAHAEAHRVEMMGPIFQFVLGLFPSIFGGDLGGNDTAAGIAMQRNQAKGRIGVFFKAMRKARAHVMAMAVEALRRNSTGALDIAVFDPGSETFVSKSIRLDDLRGEVAAYPESDEGFPASWAEKQAQIDALLGNPQAAALIFSSPKNMTVAQRMKGLGELEIPGADARQQQLREIKLMGEHAKAGMAPQPVLDPLSGQMLPPQTSTVQVDPVLDDHEAHIRASKEWAASDEGQTARVSNPALFLDLQLHVKEHMMALAASMPPPAPPGQSVQSQGPPQGGPPQ